MGVVNVTPDSFSDGGLFERADTAIEHGLRLQADGADMVDVGGQSTRPGSSPVPLAVELARVIPVVAGLVSRGVRVVSIDTSQAEVARRAIDAGAQIVNDISGGTFDP